MNTKRIFFVMVGIINFLAICSVAAVVLGNAHLVRQSKQLVELKLESRLLEEQQSALQQANKDIEKYSALEKVAKTIVPQDKDQARTVREISKIAQESGVVLSSINFQSSNLGTAVPKPIANDSESTTKAPAAPPLSQVKPVEGISGVFSLEITIASDTLKPIPYQNFLDFLARLENNRRTSHVENIGITPSGDGGSLSFVIKLNAYVKP